MYLKSSLGNPYFQYFDLSLGKQCVSNTDHTHSSAVTLIIALFSSDSKPAKQLLSKPTAKPDTPPPTSGKHNFQCFD